MSPEKRMKGHCVLTQSVVNEAMSSWLLFVVSRAGLHQPPAGLIYSNGSPTSLSKHQTGRHLAMLADRLQNKFYSADLQMRHQKRFTLARHLSVGHFE